MATRADLATLGTQVTGIDTRVKTLESAPKVSFTGNFPITYGSIGLVSGTTNFDVDRLTRKTFADSVFSIGKDCAPNIYIQAYNEACADTTNNFIALSDFTFGIKVSNIATANGSLTVSDAVANFGITTAAFTALSGATTNLPNLVYFKNATINGKVAGQDYKVVYDYQNSAFTFNDYLFNNNNDYEPVNYRNGAVVTLNATALPFSPKLTVVAGNAYANVAGYTVLNGNYYGVRAEVNPYNLGTIGLSYGQNNGNRSAVGIDANFKVGGFSLKGVYDVSNRSIVTPGYNGIGDAFNRANKAGYVNAAADLGIAKIAANFRAIDPAYANGVAGMSANDTDYYGVIAGNDNSNTWGADVFGYGGALSTTLGPVTVAAFGDRSSNYVGDAAAYRTAYGVAAGAKLFGLNLTGFYNGEFSDVNNVSGNKRLHVDANPYAYSYAYNSYYAYQETALVPFNFSSTYGGVLSHDGSAADALIKGLNFTVADAYFYGDSINDFQAYGSYKATLGGLTVTPFARYHAFNVPGNNGTVDKATEDGTAARSYNAVKYGIQVTSVPLAMIGKPSVAVAFANSITTPGNSIAVNNTAKTELFGQAAITLNDIGIAGLTPSIGYAYYQGFNVGNATVVSSASGSTATFSPTADRFYRSPLGGQVDPYSGGLLAANTASGSTQGVFAQLSYAGIGLNYGMFYYTDFKNAANNSVAQAFKVNYNINF
ncbi:hypothetical protein ACVWZX_003767 [Deinococcus sp. UYEF24]